MKHFLAVSVLVAAHCSLAASPPELKLALYRCPPGFFFKSDGKEWGRTPIDGMKIVEPSPFYGDGRVYDVQSFLKSQGIISPEGAQALLIENDGFLFVKDTVENLCLVEALGLGFPLDVPMLLRNEFFVVQFKLPSRNPDKPVPTFTELRKAAGDSWKQICAVEIFSKSGQPARIGNSRGNLPPEKTQDAHIRAPVMQSDESGVSCALETVIGPDAYTIDSTISFRFQSDNVAKGIPKTITFDGASTFWDGQMQILQLFDGSGDGTACALLMRVTIAGPNSAPIKTVIKSPEAENH